MKTNLLYCAAALALAASAADAQVPAPPTNLQAKVSGKKVTLTWENADQGGLITSNSFEGTQDDFPGEGWEVITTDTMDPICTWFQFPDYQFLEQDNLNLFIGKGEKSAYVSFDPFVPRGPKPQISAYQNEWLVSPTMDGAAYVAFTFFIKPWILDDGQYEEFPNHYYIKVSHDNGETWDEIWDARYDMLPIDGMQRAVVCLGEPTDNMKVAFVADAGDPTDDQYGLYYSWAIDDVEFYKSAPAVQAGPVYGKEAPKGVTYRRFRQDSARPDFETWKESYAPSHPMMKSPLAYHYNIYRDGEFLAANRQAFFYEDTDDKDFGTYTYEVRAAGTDGESEAASLEVKVEEKGFSPVTNFRLTSGFDEDTNLYYITTEWDDADSDFLPAVYIVYCDGQQCGFFPYGCGDYSLTHTMVVPGTYNYGVVAVYENPDGESEITDGWVTVGRRSTITGITSETDGNNVTLSWGQPTSPDLDDLKGYKILRGGKTIAESIEENSFSENIANGLYTYSVSCVYENGEESAPTNITVQSGTEPALQHIPHHEGFNTGFQPDNWQIGTYEGQTPVYYQFGFDNHFDLDIEGDGFDGGFVSTTSNVPAFIIIAAYLTSPTYDISDVTGPAVAVGFSYDFLSGGFSHAHLEFTKDRGETWEIVEDAMQIPFYTEQDLVQESAFCLPKQVEYYVPVNEGDKEVMFRLYYESFFDQHFAMDNWYVDGETAVNETEGLSDIRIRRSGDLVSIMSDEAIESVELFDISGRRIAQGAVSTLRVADKGVNILRVKTASTSKTFKLK